MKTLTAENAPRQRATRCTGNCITALFVALLVGLAGCERSTTPAESPTVTVTGADGKTCTGTPGDCAEKLRTTAAAASAPANPQTPQQQQQDQGACFGECKVSCGGATCCGSCCGCASFCSVLKGRGPIACKKEQ